MTYPGPSTTTYAFDAFGNRTGMTNGSGTTTYTYDDADRITQVQPPSPASAISYDWDDNGNLVERGSDAFEWDYEDRMVEATVNSVTTTFAYRGDGLRDSRTVGMTTTTFTWDINAGLPVVLDDGNQYLYGAGLSAMKQGSAWSYYLADGLGSTMAVVDASGTVQKSYQYGVYGGVTGGSGSLANEFDFAGQQTDPTGLQYLRARYYDPGTGVFLSREPLAVGPGWTGNPFGYAGANPARLLDPAGTWPVDSDNPTSDCQTGNCTSYGPLHDYGYPDAQAEWPDGGLIDWSLIGEYIKKALASRGESEAAQAEAQLEWARAVRSCAADPDCSYSVSTVIFVAGLTVTISPVAIPGATVITVSLGFVGFVWSSWTWIETRE